MLVLLLALAAPATTVPAFEYITAQEAVRRVSECGLGPVTTHYDPDLEENVLVASSAQSATDGQLACAYKVVGFYYTLELPPNVQPRFEALREAGAEALLKAHAHDWLSARGLLNRVPKYQQGVADDGTFTRQVETLCGPRAKGAFQSKYGFHAVNPDWAIRELGRRDLGDDVLSCLMNVSTEAGFDVTFIGNEYYPR
jgi:hypothetical protein